MLHRLPFIAGLVVCSIGGFAPAAEEPVDFRQHVQPILAERCLTCHGPVKQEAGLRLDAGRLVHRGSENGPVLTPGRAAESLLIERVTDDEASRMPPEGEPLTAEQIALLKRWIDQGAAFPDDEQVVEDPREFWSYRTPVRPPVPAFSEPPSKAESPGQESPGDGSKNVPHAAADWSANPIDAFLAAQHRKRGLVPRPPAEKPVLLRRVYLDLIGIPPTREELHAFLSDSSPDAWEQVVERLLQSPRYGERWGRHWMDVWRYSDWYGRRSQNEIRYSQYHIWRWRDWIVESLNADKGYDRMLVEMLAGDEAAPDDPGVLRATGFLARNWYKFNRNTWLQETVEHTGQAFLGATLRCARCHDHRFDPISQTDYYRFRAFFEPHDVRTDPVPGQPDIAQDGLARVFDRHLDAPTYLFDRGDDRFPAKDEPLEPGVSSAWQNAAPSIEPVPLPVESYYPALHPQAVAAATQQADAAVKAAETSVSEAKAAVATAQRRLQEFDAAAEASSQSSPAAHVFLDDDFSQPRPEFWKPQSGQWNYEDGRLKQTQVASFATMASLHEHPQNFRVRIRYRTAAGGMFRSVGFSFDSVESGDSQDVYTSANDNRPSVQAFHRRGGKQVYPPEAIVPCDVRVGRPVELEATVRGQQLTIAVDGQHKLDYTMPLPRQPGRFALWVHNGTAEFLEIKIEELAPSRDGLAWSLAEARYEFELSRLKRETARAEREALTARIDAERAKYASPPDPQARELAVSAARAERRLKLREAEEALKAAERQLAVAQAAESAVDVADDAAQESDKATKGSPSLTEAQSQVEQAQAAVAQAQSAVEQESSEYTPLGTPYPAVSSGRRLALARWLTDDRNPRTARVAVNHIWLRHFGRGIVSTPADFGLRSKPPSHPELLDWLAVEFMENGWSMKHVHRLIVTSSAYKMQSSAGAAEHADENAARDPENRLLWRMNSGRMEAEVVRDSVLAASGRLDLAMGGPDLDETLGQSSTRRSLYFRITPDNSMEFLDLFDLANPNECYERKDSVVPQQALALSNSALALTSARKLARELSEQVAPEPAAEIDPAFITAAFEQVLTRAPTAAELAACQRFLDRQAALLENPANLAAMPAAGTEPLAPAPGPRLRARENLVHVLFNHNDFVTIR